MALVKNDGIFIPKINWNLEKENWIVITAAPCPVDVSEVNSDFIILGIWENVLNLETIVYCYTSKP